MNDDELRTIIRAAIARHMSSSAPATSASTLAKDAPRELRRDDRADIVLSFAQYQISRPAGDTMCVIEPDVQCDHCGFCKCHGH